LEEDDLDDELLEAVCNCSSFTAMKTTADKRKAEGHTVKKDHFRKGTSGGWAEALGEDRANTCIDHHKQKCALLGIDPELWDFAQRAT